MEKTININAERCIGCGLCVKDCLVNALTLDENRHPRYSENGEQSCLSCQHCMTICPKAALSFGGVDPDELQVVSNVNADELLGLIKSRRSVRRYKQKDVEPEKLAKICDMLAYPPKGGNFDDLHFSIVSTREKMQEMAEATYQLIDTHAEGNPLLQHLQAMRVANPDPIFCGAPSLIIASVDKSKAAPECDTVDPIIALSYFELYAQSLGLGTLWSDGALHVIKMWPELQRMLHIPETHSPSFVLLMGEAAVRYARVPKKDTMPNISII